MALEREDDATAERLVDEYAWHLNPAQHGRMEAIGKTGRALAREALMRNAFGDHFLTDAFSGGHIPRPTWRGFRLGRDRVGEPAPLHPR